MKIHSHALLILFSILLLIPAAHSRADGPGDFAQCLIIKGYDSDVMFGEPSAVALSDRTGYIYVTDTKAGNVDVFTLQGIPVSQYGSANGLKAPLGVAVDSKGNIFVSEDDGGPIKIIDAKGEITKLDIPVGDDKVAPKPGRMTFDRDGNLYVVDRATNRVIVLDKDRKLTLRFGGPELNEVSSRTSRT